jgi:hypothetical protein
MPGAYRTADATVAAHDGRALTPSDSMEIPGSRGLWVGTGGDVRVTMVSEQVLTFEAVPSGFLLPIQVTRVWATGTTASGIIALY